ncbi:hypothetical protein HBI56_107080 [Parastagonospora nodorum]|uniref:Uncharacterized protein n=1 Tax=Phaeosphaeria nodorum (strain SN15 / ATCC MYA-4574 / FGSC 10173) TaxID=321614 RepID=A0A7U2FCT8_PHANO|nr:hypothetical protein HBH56_131810 [Parastagonospora nodorum]QRD02866.1 hypothetical protein JI435_418770 [Parastagonospora nodorum SN15]KAH3938103.1 hypothetical protein HBH54_006880 [Parastagonospora nodorum]KAH3949540.1 hypothetical protein HBH53_086760 [Parastagonospora nodorum]KAH3974851.1 hypothetical protein HBH52_134810 [Parastagonospora nodorum]
MDCTGSRCKRADFPMPRLTLRHFSRKSDSISCQPLERQPDGRELQPCNEDHGKRPQKEQHTLSVLFRVGSVCKRRDVLNKV